MILHHKEMTPIFSRFSLFVQVCIPVKNDHLHDKKKVNEVKHLLSLPILLFSFPSHSSIPKGR